MQSRYLRDVGSLVALQASYDVTQTSPNLLTQTLCPLRPSPSLAVTPPCPCRVHPCPCPIIICCLCHLCWAQGLHGAIMTGCLLAYQTSALAHACPCPHFVNQEYLQPLIEQAAQEEETAEEAQARAECEFLLAHVGTPAALGTRVDLRWSKGGSSKGRSGKGKSSGRPASSVAGEHSAAACRTVEPPEAWPQRSYAGPGSSSNDVGDQDVTSSPGRNAGHSSSHQPPAAVPSLQPGAAPAGPQAQQQGPGPHIAVSAATALMLLTPAALACGADACEDIRTAANALIGHLGEPCQRYPQGATAL